MKKLILVLAITLMIASQSFGALSVYLDRVGTGTAPAVVDIKYSGADANFASTMPRAFALKIKINNTAYVDDVINFKIGESNSTSKGFGIYPATIVIEANGTVTNYGTPVASPGDPGPGAIDTNNVVLEFGSLYSGDANVPPSSGTLCRLNINKGTASGSSTVSMTDEDVYRGGLVFEDGSQGNTSDSNVIVWGAPPAPASVPYPAHNATGVARAGVTMTWLAGSGATSHDVYFGTVNPPPSKGNQAGNTYPTGAMIQGKTYYWQIDEKNAIGTTTGSVWIFTVEECLKSTDTMYNVWKLVGKPNCFCYKRQCKGDGNGSMTLSKPVLASDMVNFQAGFNLKYTQMINKFDINGIHLLCADYNHSMTLSKPVLASDMTIFQANFNLKYTSIPQCPATNINFWMN